MLKKLNILVIVLAVLCLCSALCSAEDQWSEIQQAGVLRVGTSADYIPFVYMEGTSLDGLDVALVKEIGRRLGVDVQVIDMAFDGLSDAAIIGQIDLIACAYSITDARKEVLDFSNPYYKAGGILLCRTGEEVTQDTIHNAKLGVQKGTSFEQWVDSNLLMGGQISPKNVFTYSKVIDVVNALKDKSVDIILIDEDVYNSQFKNDLSINAVNKNVVDETYAFAAVKGSTLIPQVNTAMREMFKDGTAQKIADTYFAKDFSDQIEPSITRPAQAVAPVEAVPADMAISREITMEDVTGVKANNPANCYNGMQFVSDISIPLGTVLQPGIAATKTWNIKNTGTCTWDSGYSFNYVRGTISGPSSVKIDKLVAPGENYPISVNFTTMAANGEYTAFWQMRNAEGTNFGQTIWYDYVVDAVKGTYDENVHTGNPQIYKWYPDFYSTENGKCPKSYYEVVNAYEVDFYIDNKLVDTTKNLKGYAYICPPKRTGKYVIAIRAVGENSVSDAYTFIDNTFYQDPRAGQSHEFPHDTLP